MFFKTKECVFDSPMTSSLEKTRDFEKPVIFSNDVIFGKSRDFEKMGFSPMTSSLENRVILKKWVFLQ